MSAPGDDPQLFIQRYRDSCRSRDETIPAAERDVLDAILLCMRLEWAKFSGADELHERAFGRLDD
jgi:hypothetical protein